MKITSNLLLKIGLCILLILCLFDLEYEWYEIIRFILIASFAWLAISESEPTNKGWRFLYIVLIVLFNPFFKLEIGTELWHLVDLFVALLLLTNLILTNKIHNIFLRYIKKLDFKKYFLLVFSKRVGKILVKLIVAGLVVFIVSKGYKDYSKIQEEKKLTIIKHTQDSLANIQQRIDSINHIKELITKSIEDKKVDSINNLGKRANCNEETALAEFKKHMAFYYPTWKVKGKPKIISHGECTYQISAVVYDEKYGDFSGDALIVEISMWGLGYSQSSFVIQTKPPLFDE